MKLNKELKTRIDDFFANVTAEDLYEMSVHKYGFIEDTSITIRHDEFKSINIELFSSSSDQSYNNDDTFNNLVLAA